MYKQSFRPRRRGFSKNFGGRQNGNGYGRSSGQNRFRGRGRSTGKIDVAKFVNKAVDTNDATAHPITHKFTDFSVDSRLQANITSMGWLTPTPIQDQAIPYILEGMDFLGIASTGTGKTASFLIPLVNKVIKNKAEKVLIIAPTRELALQIDEELKKLTRGLNIWSVLCIGGADIGRQLYTLRKNPNFVIGTPGRLKDLSNKRAVNFYHFRSIVVDEVDRMFDMGFINDIREIFKLLPKERQTLFFSATIAPKIGLLIQEYLVNPQSVSIKSRDTAASVEQNIVKVIDKHKKVDQLHSLLLKEEFKKVLIFGRTKWGVKKLSQILNEKGFRSDSIHGNKTQSQRQRALNLFRQNHINILVATDVAARGLDITDVTHVINYDVPETYDDYIHRIGRTGRADKKGIALTFVE